MARGQFRRKRRTVRVKKRAMVATVPKVARMIDTWAKRNIEDKYFDTVQTSIAVDFSGYTMELLTDVPQGDTDVTRDGDSLRPVYLKIRGAITYGDASNLFRIVIFRWKQNTLSIVPTYSYLFAPTLIGTSQAPLSPYNHDTRENIHILWDKTFLVTSQNQTTVKFKKFIKLKKLPAIQFDAGGTNGNNHIYIAAISDSGAAAHPTFTYVNRLSFTDS